MRTVVGDQRDLPWVRQPVSAQVLKIIVGDRASGRGFAKYAGARSIYDVVFNETAGRSIVQGYSISFSLTRVAVSVMDIGLSDFALGTILQNDVPNRCSTVLDFDFMDPTSIPAPQLNRVGITCIDGQSFDPALRGADGRSPDAGIERGIEGIRKRRSKTDIVPGNACDPGGETQIPGPHPVAGPVPHKAVIIILVDLDKITNTIS